MSHDVQHIFHTRNEVSVDAHDHLEHSRGGVHQDRTGYRGTTRGVVRRQMPLVHAAARDEARTQH